METARGDRSSAAARSASSPRAPGSAPARWRARSAASAASRSRPAPPVLPGRRASAPSTSAAAGGSARARCSLRAGQPMTFPRTEQPSPALAATVTDRIWPNIELQWEWLGGLPPLRKAAVIGAGSWGTAVAVLLARGGLEVQLGTRTEREGRARSPQAARTSDYLPGVELPEGARRSSAPREIELAGCDLVCLAVPSTALPAAVGALGDRIGSRAAVLLLTKGLVAAAGRAARASTSPSASAPARSPASAAPPTPARRPPGWPRSCSAAPTPTCAPSSARSSTAPASSASAPTTSSGSRWPAPPRTPPRSPPRPPSRTA